MVNHLRGRSKFKNLRVSRGNFNLRQGRVEAGSVSLGNGPLSFLAFEPGIPLPLEPWEPIFIANLPGDDSVNIVEQPLSLEGVIHTWVLPVKKIEQSGGRLNINDRLTIHDGTFHMKQGRLRSDSLLIDARTPIRLTWGIPSSEKPLPTGFLQQGGRVNVAGKVLIQDGSYTLEGGRFQTENLALGDPAMESDTIRFWQSQRTPSFLQTGGRSHIRGNLEMCAPVIIDPIRLAPFRNVTYDLQAGRLRVDNDVIVGSMSVAPVSFTQSGGRANFGGTLRIEGDSSRYQISDGRLTTNVLEVGMDVFNTGGVFSMHESAKVTIRERVSLGAESVFQATPNSRLRLLGGTFQNFSQDEQALAGLNNLQLIFDGDNQSEPTGASLASYLEVAGQDLADVEEGFDGNFALAGLHVGGRFDTTLQLVDQVDNQLDDDGVEALYVDHLYVATGSTLDSGGHSSLLPLRHYSGRSHRQRSPNDSSRPRTNLLGFDLPRTSNGNNAPKIAQKIKSAFHPRPSAGNFSFPPSPAKKTTRIPHQNKTQYDTLRTTSRRVRARRDAEAQRNLSGIPVRSLREALHPPLHFYFCVRPFTTNVNSPTFAATGCHCWLAQQCEPNAHSNKTPRLSHRSLGPPSKKRQKSPPNGRIATQYKVNPPLTFALLLHPNQNKSTTDLQQRPRQRQVNRLNPLAIQRSRHENTSLFSPRRTDDSSNPRCLGRRCLWRKSHVQNHDRLSLSVACSQTPS